MVDKIPPSQVTPLLHTAQPLQNDTLVQRAADLQQPSNPQTNSGSVGGAKQRSHLHALYKEAMDGDGIEETNARSATGRRSQQRESNDPIADAGTASQWVESSQDRTRHTPRREELPLNDSTSVNNANSTDSASKKSHINELLQTKTENLNSVDKTGAVDSKEAAGPETRMSPTARLKAGRGFNPYAHASEQLRQFEAVMGNLFSQESWKPSGPHHTLLHPR